MKYFAYGSNMLTARLRERVPGAAALGSGRISGFERRFHKRGRDRSGKCGLFESPGSAVWGVVFEIPAVEKTRLDEAEGLGEGYDEVWVAVELASERLDAVTYRAQGRFVDESLRPYGWYKRLVVAGACEHELPREVVAELREVKAELDGDAERRAKAMRVFAD